MPLRGKHPGYKPYRLHIEEPPTDLFPRGRKYMKSYHWRGPWERDIEHARARKWPLTAWVETMSGRYKEMKEKWTG